MKGARLEPALALAATLALTLALPAAADTVTTDEIARQAEEIGAAGLTATYRGKTLTVTGTFGAFADTGHGTDVWVEFEKSDLNSWKVTCSFPRENTADYDRFALMKKGTPISATGEFESARDVFFFFSLKPCRMD